MGSDVRLKDLIGIMRPGDRLMIEDQTGRIIYRRQVMYFRSSGISPDRKVDMLEPHTVIFTKRIRERHLKETEGQVIPADHVTDFQFQDLEMLIYAKVKIR